MSPDRRENLAGVHPTLAGVIVKILDALVVLGHPAMVVEGVRTAAKQHECFLNHSSQVDAGSPASTHEIQPEGYGHAVDLAFQGPTPFASSHPWALLGAMVHLTPTLMWGGDWKTLKDLGHVEIPLRGKS
jgi:peptidoglycan LD-endopeptidase CwlK